MDNTDTIISQNRLLITKLYIPSYSPSRVFRHRLIQRLDVGLQVPLSLICAPAGSGKTVLLASWLQDYQKRTDDAFVAAWLSLDREDDDPTRFWHYFVAALEMACPATPLFSAAPENASSSPSMALLTSLINDIAASPYTFALVLDDYHVLHMQEIHETMIFLLDHLPSNMHLFIASREEPPLPLARLRVRNQLLELRLPDLRFTHDEVTAFLQQMTPATLSYADIAILEERTEGWIAGLQLAALSMRGISDASAFIATFTGDHRHVADYLVEEVLNRLPTHLQLFLLHTSVLNRLCAGLCNALTKQPDGQKMLEYLEQSNIFLVSLDAKRYWYRYHHLFAEALRHRLQRSDPDLLPELHLKASLWYENHGETDTAIEHALLSSDTDRAATLIECAAGACMRKGETTTLLRWLETLPTHMLHSRPKLCYFHIWTLMSGNRWQEAEEPLRVFEKLKGSDIPFTEDKIISNAMAAHAAIALYKGDISRSLDLANQALAATAPDDFIQRSYVLLYQSLAYWLNSDIERSENVLLELCQPTMFAMHPYVALSAFYNRVQLQLLRGNLRQIQAICQQAEVLVEKHRLLVPASALSLVHMAKGELLYEWNDLVASADHLTQCITLASCADGDKFLAFAYGRLAQVKFALGDIDAANDLLEQSIQCNQLLSPPRDLGQLAINLGRSAEVTRWVQRYTADVEEQPALTYWSGYITLARLFFARQQYDAALELLERLLQVAETNACTGCVIQALTLQAVVLQTQGATAQALSLLTRALSLAEPEGYIRTFLDEGAPMITLLIALTQQKQANKSAYKVSLTYVQRLLAETGVHLAPMQHNAQIHVQSLPEILSERELEILRLIAAGLSNQEITQRLVIAMSTLKTHINHIYSKLGVNSRTKAILQARKMLIL